jgi:hypothetical protein
MFTLRVNAVGCAGVRGSNWMWLPSFGIAAACLPARPW